MKSIVIKGNNWLGDAVMSLPSLKAVKTAHPRCRLTIVTRPFLASLYEMTEEIDEVIVEGKGIDGWRKTVGSIRSGRHDAALIFPRSFRSAFLFYCADVPRRIGYGGEGRSLLLTDVLERSRESLTVHRVRYYYNLLQAFGINGRVSAPSLAIDCPTEDWADGVLRASGVGDGQCLIGVNPGASYGTAKQWGVEKFAAVARRMAAGGSVMLFGGPSDASTGASVAKGGGGRVIDMTGRTTIPQLAALIRRCAVFVTNDTGPMHVAAAVGVPVVAIFGPTDTVATSPYGENGVILRKPVDCSPCLLRTCPIDHRCMERIAVAEVIEAVESAIGEKSRGR